MKKKLFLAILSTLLICCNISPTNAQKGKDQEYRHIIVTLTSGEKTEGYVKAGWHAEASHLKKSNYSFKMTPTPESKETVKYTADEVRSIEYTEKYENNPDGIRWESRELAMPSLKDRYHTARRFVCLEKAGKNASIYWWKDWDSVSNAKGIQRYLKTYWGIRFHDEGKDGEIVYSYLLATSVLLKNKKPGLKEFSKNWFKGTEGKERKKQAKEDPTWMLDMYDAYLAQ